MCSSRIEISQNIFKSRSCVWSKNYPVLIYVRSSGASLSLWWHSNDLRGNILSVHPMKSMNITYPRYSKIHIMGQHNTGSHVNTSIAPTPTSNRVHNHTSSGLIWISGEIYIYRSRTIRSQTGSKTVLMVMWENNRRCWDYRLIFWPEVMA